MTAQSSAPDSPYQLSSINQITLTPIVRQSLACETSEISNWQYQRVHGGAGDVGAVLSGVYRFTGNATVDSEIRDWSVILKVVGTKNSRSDPSEPRYWKREVLAYQSGELANLAGELAAPRFFGTIEFADNKAA